MLASCGTADAGVNRAGEGDRLGADAAQFLARLPGEGREGYCRAARCGGATARLIVDLISWVTAPAGAELQRGSARRHGAPRRRRRDPGVILANHEDGFAVRHRGPVPAKAYVGGERDVSREALPDEVHGILGHPRWLAPPPVTRYSRAGRVVGERAGLGRYAEIAVRLERSWAAPSRPERGPRRAIGRCFLCAMGLNSPGDCITRRRRPHGGAGASARNRPGPWPRDSVSCHKRSLTVAARVGVSARQARVHTPHWPAPSAPRRRATGAQPGEAFPEAARASASSLSPTPGGLPPVAACGPSDPKPSSLTAADDHEAHARNAAMARHARPFPGRWKRFQRCRTQPPCGPPP